jgi:hypothetical protein
MTLSTQEWAIALTRTKAAATRLHRTLFRRLWATIRTHWRTSCEATVAAIEEDGDADLLHSINAAIRDGRTRHSAAAPALDAQISRHHDTLERRARRWHEDNPG